MDGPATPAAPDPGRANVQPPTVPPVQAVAPQPPAVLSAATVTKRRLGDTPALRQSIYDSVLKAAASLEPVKNSRYTLSLHDPHYEGADSFSIKQQKERLLGGGTLARRLRGTWRLTDNATGQVVDQTTSTLAHVPHLTDRGVYVLDGSDYVLSHQSRLRPGVYTRRQANGELESHVNVQGRGASHRIFLEPETGVFKVRIGQAEVPLIPLVKALGAKDSELREAWGKDIHAANIRHDSDHDLGRLYDRMVKRGQLPAGDVQGRRQALADVVRSLRLDPEVTRSTLGKAYETVDKDVYLAATRRLLDVSRGRADIDDREHLAYQQVLGPEDLLAERIGRERSALQKALWQATFNNNLSRVPIGIFTPGIRSVVQMSGLGSAPEGVSAAEFVDHGSRITRLGDGGLSSGAIPDEARNVHPSQLGFLDVIKTPESESAGVDLRISFGAQKGSDGRLYAPFRDPHTGKIVYKSPQDLLTQTVAFPGELASGKPFVRAIVRGRMRPVRREKVGLELPSMEQAFSPLANLVPLKSTIKGQRGSMGARMIAQALALENPEVPHVRTAVPGRPDVSFDDLYGRHAGAVFSRASGRVESVTPDEIVLKHDDGTRQSYELYRHFPNNRKTGLHNTPLVKPGDVVAPDQVLARSNYTNEKGQHAYGINARVAYLPAHAIPYEDAALISESFAKRMSSGHYNQHVHEWDDSHRRGKKAFVSLFPGTYDRKILDKMDDDGVIKVGQTVNPGDPLILIPQVRERDFAQAGRSARINFADRSQTWEHHAPGVVTDVINNRGRVNVVVRSVSEMKDGDKLAGKFGNKSVVRVMADDKMPHDEQGRPFEVAWSPLQTISRTNPGMAIEAWLGKVADKTGQPYTIEDWGKIPDAVAFAKQELDKHGLKARETVIDPVSGRKIPGVMTGHSFLMKLHHMAEGKVAGRGLGSYDAAGAPQKTGGDDSAKRLSVNDSAAILAHGATAVLRDAHAIRGAQNTDFWLAYMAGFPPPHPRVPPQYEKFLSELTAAGIKVRRDGPRLHLMALTDRDVNELAGSRSLENADTVRWDRGLEPVKGGLFDPKHTGGHGAATWSKIDLHEPMPNPAFEEPVRRLLGLTEKAFLNVLAGRQELPNKKTGPAGILAALKDVQTSTAIAKARKDIASGRKGARDEAVRRLAYLKASEKTGVHPSEWVLHAVPVLPPTFRPVSVMKGNKGQLVADPNALYKEVWDANQNLKALSGRVADVGEERLALYSAFKAVVGLGAPTHAKNVERGVKGLIETLLGSSGKYSVLQSKLLGTTTDLSGRAVITPDPDLDMDSIGLPESKAWDTFTPFVVRRLVRRGMPRLEAMRSVQDRTKTARDALQQEMGERPVLVNRYPILHRYNLMAFKPKLVSGDVIRLSPLVTKGYGADFDGNCLVSEVKLGLRVNPAVLQDTPGGAEWLSKFQETVMRQGEKTAVTIRQSGLTLVTLPIGNFPRSGTPIRDDRGSEIYQVPEGVEVLTYEHGTGRSFYAPVTRFTVDKDHACVKAITRYGRDVTVSDNESLCVFDHVSGDLTAVRPDQAKEAWVPVAVREPHFGTDFDFETGWWYGAFVADGWSGNRIVGYAKNDKLCRDTFVRIARTKFTPNFIATEYQDDPSKHAARFGTANKVHLTGRDLPAMLYGCLADRGEDDGRASLFKKIPDELLASGSRECLLGLLSGLMDGDCTLGWSSAGKHRKTPQFVCSFCTSSPTLRDGIVRLWRRFGVRCSVTVSPAKGVRRDAYIIQPSLYGVHRLACELRLVYAGRQKALQEFLATGLNVLDQNDFVPVTKSALQKVNSVGIKALGSGLYYAVRSAIKGHHALVRETARRALAFLDSSDPDAVLLQRMVDNTDVTWDRVVDVQTSETQDVFDLEVPATKVFAIDNGLVVYDTMSWHVPVAEDAVKDALDKMLPSKNLWSAARHRQPMYAPGMEFQQGLHVLSTARDDVRPRTFRNKADALAAYRRGEIGMGQPVEIVNR